MKKRKSQDFPGLSAIESDLEGMARVEDPTDGLEPLVYGFFYVSCVSLSFLVHAFVFLCICINRPLKLSRFENFIRAFLRMHAITEKRQLHFRTSLLKPYQRFFQYMAAKCCRLCQKPVATRVRPANLGLCSCPTNNLLLSKVHVSSLRCASKGVNQIWTFAVNQRIAWLGGHAACSTSSEKLASTRCFKKKMMFLQGTQIRGKQRFWPMTFTAICINMGMYAEVYVYHCISIYICTSMCRCICLCKCMCICNSM